MNKKYSTKEIASILHQSSTSNIRHIARHMEKLGYVIERDEYDRREYNETDKKLFSQIQELKDSGVKLREAIDSVLSNQEINDEKRDEKEMGIPDSGLKTFCLS
ncbi:MerR family transcriptional regulator [Guptibacillus hwajinpoensis]|uniref:DNA-binding transcriptional MerR regulator n=1 Tax=Guptibacillus hwajinpoensis TaxID=208199 RepID=A0ABU0JZB8_9BACL|nr:MerR family transcriptional regulator [Alkalihalobacillus hemicentroti]MDQ0482449.1 DNA-binding transcriptional MerR regulator [Alkalihalobacillus hemicentroti]